MLTTSDMMMQTMTSNQPFELRRRAVSLFRREQQSGWMHRLAAFLRGECPALDDLQQVNRSGRVRGSHYAGLQTVSLDAIQGSEARTTDFDHHFHPRNARSLWRWVSIFQARMNEEALPPVELIQVGSEYYVRDGHHRLSVAHALGEHFIEAEVTVWDLAR